MSDRPSPTLVAKDVYRAGRDRLRPLAVYLSRVPAGFPSAANDYVERRLDLNEHLIPRESSTFFVRVAGALDAGRRHPRRRSSGRGPGRGADRRGPRLMPRLLQRAISPALDSGTLSDPNRYRTRTTLRVAV